MLPDIAKFDINTQAQRSPTIGKSFLFDFTAGDFVIKDGRLVKTEDIEALKGWITKVLKTEKFRFAVYAREDKNEYGVTIEDLLIGYNYPPQFIESELKREIESALVKQPMISSLSNWSITRDGAKANIVFRVNLVTGVSFNQEVTI
ncbi:DUF2634 domain-containing protein [Thermanaerosceptrum fracticalcis]|uniref:DUF2634 domain-containing protein n=1 Tax=Thermanaerosceptrum fracticalcis TaxID=1712410 RepID=A0A7G6E812_THEFR|nr:DUF2634 domain-containing protein [Thermanaerosceptrum fracticalcis]QNB48216.1 DUF2634 domain-containing protein [Thermanaerosceptrum fracticalcis]